MNLCKAAILVTAAALLCGCTGLAPKPMVEMSVKALSRESAIDRIIVILVREGYEIAEVNRVEGHVATKARRAEGFIKPAREKAHVLIRRMRVKHDVFLVDVTLLLEGDFEGSGWSRGDVNSHLYKEEVRRTRVLADKVKTGFKLL